MLTKNDAKLNRKANQCRIVGSIPGGYRVKSPSGSTYSVDLDNGLGCGCSWGRKGGAGCAHERAARKHRVRLEEGRAVSFNIPGTQEADYRIRLTAESGAITATTEKTIRVRR